MMIATIPAHLLTVLLPPNLSLVAVSGTVWRGEAARAVLSTPAGSMTLGRLSWRLSPLSLIRFSPAVELRSQWGNQRLAATVNVRGADRLALKALTAEFDAGLIRQFAPLYVGGRLRLDVAQAEIAGGVPTTVNGRLVWEQAVWTADRGDSALGSYALPVETRDSVITGEWITLEGPLVIEGTVQLQERNYRLDIDLSGPALTDPMLAASLRMMAVPTAGGFELAAEGRF
ncbi:bacterial type II secretion system protein N [Luminiphilus syltensis NOR5-1B]|uniref:Type II secretion system protein N n=2 Tax=Luminiphilus TaxID=1341118 RepID=B8KQL8_9GAMM|nr:bacterial type II secretion system protein N [Luminiphilus syltensis NOR5-1B]